MGSELDNTIRRAIDNQDCLLAVRIGDFFRHHFGMNYGETYDRVVKACPSISKGDWDALLLEGSQHS